MSTLTPHDIEVALRDALAAGALPAELTALDAHTWLLAYAGSHDVLAEWAEQPARLVLTAALDPVDPEHLLLACKTALTFNARWHVNGSLRVGLDHEDGSLLLLTDVLQPDMHMPELAEQLADFHRALTAWNSVLDRMTGSSGPLRPSPGPVPPTHAQQSDRAMRI